MSSEFPGGPYLAARMTNAAHRRAVEIMPAKTAVLKKGWRAIWGGNKIPHQTHLSLCFHEADGQLLL
jgi:hypothetical protein